jgi:hypothetical protein
MFEPERTDTYLMIKNHVITNMFLALKRPAPQYRKVVLHSVGDHIDPKTGYQDYMNCDLYLEIDNETPVSEEVRRKLEIDTKWAMKIVLEGADSLYFTVDKTNQMIGYGRSK